MTTNIAVKHGHCCVARSVFPDKQRIIQTRLALTDIERVRLTTVAATNGMQLVFTQNFKIIILRRSTVWAFMSHGFSISSKA
jgi:hypothetical protein